MTRRFSSDVLSSLAFIVAFSKAFLNQRESKGVDNATTIVFLNAKQTQITTATATTIAPMTGTYQTTAILEKIFNDIKDNMKYILLIQLRIYNKDCMNNNSSINSGHNNSK